MLAAVSILKQLSFFSCNFWQHCSSSSSCGEGGICFHLVIFLTHANPAVAGSISLNFSRNDDKENWLCEGKFGFFVWPGVIYLLRHQAQTALVSEPIFCVRRLRTHYSPKFTSLLPDFCARLQVFFCCLLLQLSGGGSSRIRGLSFRIGLGNDR